MRSWVEVLDPRKDRWDRRKRGWSGYKLDYLTMALPTYMARF